MRLFVILGFLLPIWLPAQYASASDFYGAGLRAYYAGQYDSAIQYFNSALALRPGTKGYLYSRGQAYQKLYRDSLADLDFLALTSQDPRYIDAWYQLGMVQVDEKNYDSARMFFSNALRISPGDLKSLDQLGLVMYYKRNYFDAIDLFSKVIALSPDDEQAYYKRGLARMNEEDYAGAIKDFSESYAINPENTLALEQRALSFLRYNDLENACRDWHMLNKKGNQRILENIRKYCEK